MPILPCVMAIDPSLTGFAVTVLGKGIFEEAEISTKATKCFSARMARLMTLVSYAETVAKKHCPELILIEGYSFGSKGRATISLAELGGILRYELHKYDFNIVEVPPTVIKKFVCGKGNANKTLVATALSTQYRRSFSSDNLADAFGLAKLGAMVLGWDDVSYKYQKDAVDTVTGLIQQEKQNVNTAREHQQK